MPTEATTDDPVLQVDDDGHLRILRLNRPHAKNALNGALIDGISRELRAAADDAAVRAVLITGNGDAFCAGLDLATAAEVSTTSPAAVGSADGEVGGEVDGLAGGRSDDRAGDDDRADGDGDGERGSPGYAAAENMAMLARITCTKPVIAAVNGAAVGIGVSLALAADIRIASPNARFHPGYARVGTSPDGGGTWTVTQALGYERALRFFLESRMVHAPEALAIGLVSEVVDTPESLLERAVAYGQHICSLPPIAVRQTKQLVGRTVALADLARHLDDEVHATIAALASDDGRRAVEALLTGKPATYTGS